MSIAAALRGDHDASKGPSKPESPYLTEAARKMRDAIAALAPTIRKNALDGEALGALPEETLQALDATGFFRISIPIEHGGFAFGARDITEVIEAAAVADGSTAWMGFVAGGIRNVLAFSDKAQGEIFALVRDWAGPLAVGASVFSPIVGEARRVEGGFMVKGKWMFGSGCRHAAWAVVGIEWQEDDGPRRGLGILSRDQYEIVDDWHVMGLKGTSSNSITARDEVFMPDYRAISAGELPMKLAQLRGRFAGLAYQVDPLGLMLVTCLSNVAIGLGMAKGCLAEFVDQAKARKPFNLPYDTVADMASTQVTAGKVHAMVSAAEALMYRTADEVDRRATAGLDFLPREESLLTMDLVYAANLCAQAIDLMQIALGSSTVALKNPIQRFVRDARVLITHGAIRPDPSAEISGRHVLGLAPYGMFAGGLPQR